MAVPTRNNSENYDKVLTRNTSENYDKVFNTPKRTLNVGTPLGRTALGDISNRALGEMGSSHSIFGELSESQNRHASAAPTRPSPCIGRLKSRDLDKDLGSNLPTFGGAMPHKRPARDQNTPARRSKVFTVLDDSAQANGRSAVTPPSYTGNRLRAASPPFRSAVSHISGCGIPEMGPELGHDLPDIESFFGSVDPNEQYFNAMGYSGPENPDEIMENIMRGNQEVERRSHAQDAIAWGLPTSAAIIHADKPPEGLWSPPPATPFRFQENVGESMRLSPLPLPAPFEIRIDSPGSESDLDML